MTVPRRRAGVLTFLIGAAAGLGGARLFASRGGAAEDSFSTRTGRGSPAEPPSRDAVTAGYETEDASARDLFRIMALFAGSALGAIFLMVYVLHVLHGRDAAHEAGLSRVQTTSTEPPEPRLQPDPVRDIDSLLGREHALLHGMTRLSATTARIPIERAMALLPGQPLDGADQQGNGRQEIGR